MPFIGLAVLALSRVHTSHHALKHHCEGHAEGRRPHGVSQAQLVQLQGQGAPRDHVLQVHIHMYTCTCYMLLLLLHVTHVQQHVHVTCYMSHMLQQHDMYMYM